MSTFEDLVQEVLLHVEGYLGQQDVYGTVSDAGGAGTFWDATDTTTGTVSGGTYADGSGFTPGIIEVSDELIYAEAFDRATGVFTGCLRGWRGSTAAAHVAGEIVRNNPRFPRIQVKRAINDTVTNLYPELPAMKTTQFTAQGAVARYDLPTDARGIQSVRWSLPGSSGVWTEAKQWRFDSEPGGETAGNRSIDVMDVLPGRTVRVVYRAEPSSMASGSDVFSTTTGLEDFAREVVVYGAVSRLMSGVDLGKVSGTSASQKLLNQVDPVGGGSEQAKYYMALYQQKLVEAKSRLREMYPVKRHQTWW